MHNKTNTSDSLSADTNQGAKHAQRLARTKVKSQKEDAWLSANVKVKLCDDDLAAINKKRESRRVIAKFLNKAPKFYLESRNPLFGADLTLICIHYQMGRPLLAMLLGRCTKWVYDKTGRDRAKQLNVADTLHIKLILPSVLEVVYPHIGLPPLLKGGSMLELMRSQSAEDNPISKDTLNELASEAPQLDMFDTDEEEDDFLTG